MASKGFFSYGVPPMSWELGACSGSGLTLSQLRFTLAFVVSVVVGAILRHVPTVKGAPGERATCSTRCSCRPVSSRLRA